MVSPIETDGNGVIGVLLTNLGILIPVANITGKETFLLILLFLFSLQKTSLHLIFDFFILLLKFLFLCVEVLLGGILTMLIISLIQLVKSKII